MVEREKGSCLMGTKVSVLPVEKDKRDVTQQHTSPEHWYHTLSMV